MFDRKKWKRAWHSAHRERILAKQRDYYRENRAKILQQQKKLRDSDLISLHKRRKERYYAQVDKSRAYLRYQAEKLKREMFDNLGKICICCGVDDLRFLSLDHINNDGWKEKYPNGRRLVGIRVAKCSGWDKTKFQILCYNCNLGKSTNSGVCPHQQSLSSVVPLLEADQETH